MNWDGHAHSNENARVGKRSNKQSALCHTAKARRFMVEKACPPKPTSRPNATTNVVRWRDRHSLGANNVMSTCVKGRTLFLVPNKSSRAPATSRSMVGSCHVCAAHLGRPAKPRDILHPHCHFDRFFGRLDESIEVVGRLKPLSGSYK